jgi:hypothetical protein
MAFALPPAFGPAFLNSSTLLNQKPKMSVNTPRRSAAAARKHRTTSSGLLLICIH